MVTTALLPLSCAAPLAVGRVSVLSPSCGGCGTRFKTGLASLVERRKFCLEVVSETVNKK
ncbi:hypothetical protein M406DRAFT_321230 [Cryphonectria parasitica EP155]|uniref:Secreted protein n=1 Tax=Cryphonectria parasitica (strain ATCC 38755 / EP155) TaxID=660469 RepID=A0A9P4YA49_CRYP1|nr:uncharacterized protein M406DRAFT_321230 [Cryphonectria parasitica EP155]KAF3769255.1 hypothetical protein M406DRAFT_321230 [Cryphonectria parasitica EP155]